jgi:hypothetical protein
MHERNLNEGQWDDRKQWSLRVGQRRRTFWNRYTYIHTHTIVHTPGMNHLKIKISNDTRLTYQNATWHKNRLQI